MAHRFRATRHVHLKLTTDEADAVAATIAGLRPDEMLLLLPVDEDARAPLALGRVRKRVGQGVSKLTLYEGRVLLDFLTTLNVLPAIRSRLGVELARQGGAKVGR